MSEGDFDDTQAISVIRKTGPEPARRGVSRWLLIVLGVVGLLAVAAIAAYGGYRSGIQQRLDQEATQVASQVITQFELGLQDFEAKRYDVARQRFEYVIQLDPDYPGVTEMLAQTLLAMSVTATPTPVPTPTLTPTPDLRGAEDLFFQAEQQLAENDWTGALETLDALRKKQPDFMPIQVDGMYYVALRNRGVEKIQQGQLEGGMYDLSRAEQFGPLDVDAEAWRSWARLYVTGASFWEVNWAQAISYFSELALVAPNLRDQSNWTATERLRVALIRYGDQFASAGDYCSAQKQYEAALAFGPDPTIEPTATHITEACFTPTPKPKPPTETPEVSPTGEAPPIPSETPGGPPPEGTPTPTGTPST